MYEKFFYLHLFKLRVLLNYSENEEGFSVSIISKGYYFMEKEAKRYEDEKSF